MKILLASTSSGSRGGGELGLLYLGRALTLRGHEPALWVSDHPRMDELSAKFAEFGPVRRARYVNTYDRPSRSIASYFDTTTAQRVAAEWRTCAPDVVHVNKQNLEDGLELLAAAQLSGRPSLAMIHITQSAAYLRAVAAAPRDFVARRALRRFPGLLVTTPGNRRNDLVNFIGASPQIRTVSNGVPVPNLGTRAAQRASQRKELKLTDEDLLFTAVGRMVAQKRPLLFLEIAAQVRRELPTARFLWVGEGDLAGEWDRTVAALGLAGFVQRLAWQADVASFLAAADVFMHVSAFEGLAFAILEALASGLPCAITPNLLTEMPFLNPENSIAIEEGCSWLRHLREPSQRAALGQAARRLAEDQFSFGRMARDYETLYREVIAQHP